MNWLVMATQHSPLGNDGRGCWFCFVFLEYLRWTWLSLSLSPILFFLLSFWFVVMQIYIICYVFVVVVVDSCSRDPTLPCWLDLILATAPSSRCLFLFYIFGVFFFGFLFSILAATVKHAHSDFRSLSFNTSPNSSHTHRRHRKARTILFSIETVGEHLRKTDGYSANSQGYFR